MIIINKELKTNKQTKNDKTLARLIRNENGKNHDNTVIQRIIRDYYQQL